MKMNRIYKRFDDFIQCTYERMIGYDELLEKAKYLDPKVTKTIEAWTDEGGRNVSHFARLKFKGNSSSYSRNWPSITLEKIPRLDNSVAANKLIF